MNEGRKRRYEIQVQRGRSRKREKMGTSTKDGADTSTKDKADTSTGGRKGKKVVTSTREMNIDRSKRIGERGRSCRPCVGLSFLRGVIIDIEQRLPSCLGILTSSSPSPGPGVSGVGLDVFTIRSGELFLQTKAAEV